MIAEKTSVALGLFDGVHLGHRAVLRLALLNTKKGCKSAVFTFRPDAVLRKRAGDKGYIYTFEEKQRILKNCGFDEIYSPSFSEMCDMTGEEFAVRILVGKMNAAAVCCGNDFRFGKNAACGVEELRKFGRIYGFEVFTADDVTLNGTAVSSGRIRQLLLNGDIKQANSFLDAPYTIAKEVVSGAALGRTIGYPTANQLFEDGQLVPKFGVYAAEVTVNGKSCRAMTNIGIKPTVQYGGKPLAETYISRFSGNLYGSVIQVKLLDFIRPEQKFNSIDELKKQISADIEKLQAILP